MAEGYLRTISKTVIERLANNLVKIEETNSQYALYSMEAETGKNLIKVGFFSKVTTISPGWGIKREV